MAGAGGQDLRLPGPWQHRNVPANGIRFHVAVGSNYGPRRPLVLLVHGFAQFWWAWRHQIPALDAAGYGVAAVDLRGYGASDKTPHGYDAATTAADVGGVVRSLGHHRAVVVGHDWGAMAAWSTAAYAPHQVEALAVIAAPHPLALPWRHVWSGLAFAQLPVLPERWLMADDGAGVERLLRSWAADGPALMTPKEARPYRDALLRWPSPHCALAYPRAFVRTSCRAAGVEHRRALRRGTAAPVLSVHGQWDRLVPHASMAAAGAYVTGRHDLVSLPGVGHLPSEEAPNQVSEALLAWLDRLELG